MGGIAFPTLSDAIRVPFAYAEFDPMVLADDASIMPYTVLLIGQMSTSGDFKGKAEPLTIQRPMSAGEAANLFGQGSMLATMCAAYFKANTITKMLCIGVADAAEGTAAQGALTLNGTVTSAAPLCLYIGGTRVRASAPSGATAAQIAESLTTSINSDKTLPVTATFSGGQITLTARHKGECGNDVDLRLNYADETMPGGITATFTAMSGGTGNPDPAPIIAAMQDEQYHVIGVGMTDIVTLAALKAEFDDRWGPMRQIDGQALMVKRGTFGTCTTFSGARNDKHLTVIPSEGSPTNPWEDCAACVGIVAYYGNNDPARPFNTLVVPGVLAPAKADRWANYPDKNQGLFEGLSTRFVNASGQVCLQKLITTYRINAAGADDDAFLSLNSPLTLSYLRHDWNNYLKLKYPRHKLAGDADASRFDSTQPIMTPSLGKSEAIARCADVWVPQGLVEGLDAFKRSILCARNDKNPNRLDWMFEPDLVNQFEIAGTLIRHIV